MSCFDEKATFRKTELLDRHFTKFHVVSRRMLVMHLNLNIEDI